MSQTNRAEYYEAVFDVAWKSDYYDFAFWSPRGAGGWTAYAVCSDTFYWATADAEAILPEDVPLLKECLDDLLTVERECSESSEPTHRNDAVATSYLPSLFAARKRKLRPMRACYEDKDAMGPKVAALFDAAGPPREDDEGKKRLPASVLGLE